MRAVAILEATDDDDPDDDAIRVAAAAVLEEAAPQAEDADAEVELVPSTRERFFTRSDF